MKKILSLLFIFVLFFTSIISVFATNLPSAKEEVVYGILNIDGGISELFVVNIFNGGTITDYGNYSEVRNMTSSENINRNGDQITINTTAEKFYYQGTIENNELPWNISIKYYLDDKEVSGDALAGKNGKLKIAVSVTQNKNLSSIFFDNYALQIAISLDNKLASNITADNATIAEAGSKKQITYTILPGNEFNASVAADVRSFEMDPITINGIKISLGINFDTERFTGQISELTDAIKKLDDGAGELLDGLRQLSIGMQKYIDGLSAFTNGVGQLSAAADQLNTGATGLKNGLSELTNQNEALIYGALAMQQATFDSVNAELNKMGLGLPVLTPESYNTVLSSIPQLAAAKTQLDGVVQFTQGLKGYLDGVAQLSLGASDLAIGTAEFKDSSSLIASSANELYMAGLELNNAIKKITDGLALYKNGTRQLRDGTSDMSLEINNQIEEMLGSISGNSDEVVSFVSDKNTNVSSVQFVLRTASINLPVLPRITPPEPLKLSFWQKLLKLFGLYK